jgi:putative ABC transport system permease protein
MRLKLAVRNITRHRLRSLLSVGMIAGAVISMIIFRGFSDYSLEALKRIAAENQYGHMQIAFNKYWSPGKESRKEKMFDLNTLNPLKEQFSSIEKISGRLSFFGLVSNGDLSVGAKIIGVDTINEPTFSKSMRILSGQFVSGHDAREVMVGSLLSKQLNVKPGDSITVLTNTVDGIMNAMDLTVSGIYSAGIDEIDGQVIYLPLNTTQLILDTPNVDLAVIKFNQLSESEANASKINIASEKLNPDFKARTWRELAVLFRQVDKFYGVQNTIIECILLALMFLGILNTVSMTVVERTGEIGTLRSMGESRKDIIKQFVIESFLIGVIGVILGIIASIFIIQLIHAAGIMTEMPGASIPFQIRINFLYSAVIFSSLLAIVTAVIATLIPAIRASKMDIVEALRKNI